MLHPSAINCDFVFVGVTAGATMLDQLRVMRRNTLEKACESTLKQGVYEIASKYIKASLDINKEANLEKSTAQIRLWVDLNHARAVHAASEDQVCRILSRNMRVLQEMTPTRQAGTRSQRLTLQALHSATAQV